MEDGRRLRGRSIIKWTVTAMEGLDKSCCAGKAQHLFRDVVLSVVDVVICFRGGIWTKRTGKQKA